MKRNFFLIIIASLFLISGCKAANISSRPDSQKNLTHLPNLYTKYNIHVINYGKDVKAHYTNRIGPFSGHSIVPLNTKVILKKWSDGFILQRVDTRQNIYYYYHKQHMKMNVTQYINLITSNKKLSLSSFSNLDKKGVKNGKAYLGMTKAGVLAALGYPSQHKTPSLRNKFWVYWKNKWLTMIVKFDSAGTVISIVE